MFFPPIYQRKDIEFINIKQLIYDAESEGAEVYGADGAQIVEYNSYKIIGLYLLSCF